MSGSLVFTWAWVKAGLPQLGPNWKLIDVGLSQLVPTWVKLSTFKVRHLELGPSVQIMHEFKLGIFNWVPVGISNLRREAIWSNQF